VSDDRGVGAAIEGSEIELTVNGRPSRVARGTTVRALLESLDLVPATIVVELNLGILDRGDYASVVLEGGDRLELVHFVGGG
jgi:thiamine biosynthesis protein ThiS